MRAAIFAYLDEGSAGLDPAVRQAVERSRNAAWVGNDTSTRRFQPTRRALPWATRPIQLPSALTKALGRAVW
jgi:hypothetical protein